MKHMIRLLAIITFTVTAFSCVKEGHVVYDFEVLNATDTPMTVRLSSWGNYRMFINGMYSSKYKFHEVETIDPYSSLMFRKNVGNDPNPNQIPSSLIPGWEYIVAIECGGIVIPKEYFTDRENWELGVARQINGTFTNIRLEISPELIDRLSQATPEGM